MRAIHGAEIDLADGRHLTLLVRDARGWRNLCRLLTHAHAHTREGPGRERGSRPWSWRPCSSTARGSCASPAARRGASTTSRPRGGCWTRSARATCASSCSAPMRGATARATAPWRPSRARLGVACVATGNVHAHARSRAELQDAFVALRHRTTLDASEPLRRGNHSHVLSAPRGDGQPLRRAPPTRCARASRLAEELRFDLTRDLGYRYPGAEDAGAMAHCGAAAAPRRTLRPGRARAPRDATGGWTRAGRRAAPARAEAAGRLEEELRIIDELGLAGFFLLHHELLEMAREVAAEVRGRDAARALLAPGRGRGSSVSSIVCYLTGLSHIDPIQNRLLLGRFLHTGLSTCPTSTSTSRARSARS